MPKIIITITLNDQQLKDITDLAHANDDDLGAYMSNLVSEEICDHVTWDSDLDDYEIEVVTKS